MNDSRQPPFRPEKRCCTNGFLLHATFAWRVAVAGVLLLASFWIGCDRQDTSRLSPEREEAVADTIRSLATVGLCPTPEPYLQLYRKDAPFYAAGARFSRSEHEQLVENNFSESACSNREVKPSEPEVDVLGPGAAVASVRLRGTAADSAGETREVHAAKTLVYELQDGEWKVVQAHESLGPGKSP